MTLARVTKIRLMVVIEAVVEATVIGMNVDLNVKVVADVALVAKLVPVIEEVVVEVLRDVHPRGWFPVGTLFPLRSVNSDKLRLYLKLKILFCNSDLFVKSLIYFPHTYKI